MAFTYKDYTESDAVRLARDKANQYSTYNESDAVKNARTAMQTHEANKVADWTGGNYGQAVQDSLAKLNNRQKFSYDLNGDALYQQYKDQYINAGRLAMADTMGQASAMTGGYGNSYAATAGNQAYQSYLQNLNDVVPELYQMALNQYNQEGQDLKDNLSINQSLYNTEYGEYRDKVSDWNTEAARLSDAYNNERNFDYSQFSSDRDYYNTAYNNERTYDYNQYSDAYNRAFGNYQQQVSEDQFAKNYALEQAQLAETKRANDQSSTIASLKAQLNAKNSNSIDVDSMNSYYSKFNDIYNKAVKKSGVQNGSPQAWSSIEKEINKLADNGKINEAEYNYLMDRYVGTNKYFSK